MSMRLSNVACGDLSFSSDYDSGNASRVEQVDEHEFALWTACDAEGTQFEKGYRTVRMRVVGPPPARRRACLCNRYRA